MVARDLPSRPNLEQYKKQAKDLLKQWKAHDPEALFRVAEHASRPAVKPSLADAQFVIAREHGFDTWSKFAGHVRLAGKPLPDTVWKLAETALIAGDLPTLEQLMREHEEQFRDDQPPASTAGGLSPDYSGGDARAIIARNHQFETWEQFSGFNEVRADVSSPTGQFEQAVEAVIAGNVAELERLLRVNRDLIRARSTRMHHSTLLHYVGPNGIEYFHQKTPKNAPDVARLLLREGADVNATADIYGGGATTFGLAATSITPVLADVLVPLLEALLEGGATIDGPSAGSLVNVCLANGRPQAAGFLADRGAQLDLEGAAGVGRLDVVKSFFHADGRLKAGATHEQMKDGFTWACEFGHSDVVVFLLEKGMDVASRLKHHGQTGLHWAAGGAHVETVEILVRHGAPVNAKDETWGVTPLRWALYGWETRWSPRATPERYYRVVAMLVVAGATVSPEWLELEKVRADPQLMAALESRM